MVISEIREKTSQGLLDFAWRQWGMAGVSANVSAVGRYAIDPEALVLFTIGLARRDPRLFDEMLDWLVLNHRLLSMQRLRNLTNRFPVDPRLVAAVIAWTREPVPSQLLKAERPPENVPVFSPDVLGFVAQADPTFEEYGFIRPPAVRSGKSTEPDVRVAANLAFRLRHLFGPGTRSEAMRVLLIHPGGPLDVSRIADEIAFAKRNTSDTLNALTASGTVRATWWGNERQFVVDHGKWAELLSLSDPGTMPSFVSWVHLLPAALEISLWLDGEAGSTDSEYLVASRARGLMDRLTHDLQIAGVELPEGPPAHGADYLRLFAEANSSLLARLGIGD